MWHHLLCLSSFIKCCHDCQHNVDSCCHGLSFSLTPLCFLIVLYYDVFFTRVRDYIFHLSRSEFVLLFFSCFCFVLFCFVVGVVVVLSYIFRCQVSLSSSSHCPFSRLCDCLPLPDVFHLYPIIPASLGYTVCVLPALWQFVCSSVSRSHLPVLCFWLFPSLFMVRAASF